jgi:hypothetical protein
VVLVEDHKWATRGGYQGYIVRECIVDPKITCGHAAVFVFRNHNARPLLKPTLHPASVASSESASSNPFPYSQRRNRSTPVDWYNFPNTLLSTLALKSKELNYIDDLAIT